jgi:uncharacterized protein (DUF488 family)
MPGMLARRGRLVCAALANRRLRTENLPPLATIYTIGHSTRALDEFLRILEAHAIQILVDIRSFPGSGRQPHFNRESLEKSLPAAGIRYLWLKALGGRRKKTLEPSPNLGLRSPGFRNYADYMLTPEFERGIGELRDLAEQARTAYMCAERVYFRCHRMLVSDWLVAHGHQVLHIDRMAPATPHKLTPEARLVGGQLIYRGDWLL